MKKILLSMLAVLLTFYFVPANAFAAVKDTDLTAYLAEISKERGYEISKEDYENYLSDYADSSLSDFNTVDEMKEFLGPVIKSNNSNLTEIYSEYDLNEQQLKELLAKNGEQIEDYIYVEDLSFAVSDFMYDDSEESDDLPSEEDFAAIEKEMQDALAEIDLTPQEIDNLMNHLLSLEKELNNPATEKQLMDILNRMEGIDPENPTKAQIQQVGQAFEDLLSIFQMKAKFYIVDGSKKTPVTAAELMQMTVLEGDYLLIELYDLKGNLLADLKITSDEIAGSSGTVGEVTKTVENAMGAAPQKPVKKPSPKTPRTENGGELPKTASNNLDGALAGAAIIGAGLFLYRRARMS
ncbi:processed acidic surface protein [Fictibacillus fluitans]|uniref:Processed acidic surface protein n=1 Tax=Fictibacillus fluitans TaxID=3058422 RepID=A0ABT8HVN7_9BACL|nr:processed acidic surface protein [Fictibacillus sp. NE201]MDN4524834.1 processed acidic surface protein [Fictibacillus sp. NE201]